MKRQLERLRGKRLVTGDANLMTKNEICINTTSNGGVEVKEIGIDGKIKDLASSGSNGEPDDLLTYLYYRYTPELNEVLEGVIDLSVYSIGCMAVSPLVKMDTQEFELFTRDSFIAPISVIGSGADVDYMTMIAIPKYIYLGDMGIPGDFPDYMNIIDYFALGLESNGGDVELFKNLMKSLETTREEFVNLDK